MPYLTWSWYFGFGKDILWLLFLVEIAFEAIFESVTFGQTIRRGRRTTQGLKRGVIDISSPPWRHSITLRLLKISKINNNLYIIFFVKLNFQFVLISRNFLCKSYLGIFVFTRGSRGRSGRWSWTGTGRASGWTWTTSGEWWLLFR